MEQRVSSSKSIKHAASLSSASYHKIVPNWTIPYIEFQQTNQQQYPRRPNCLYSTQLQMLCLYSSVPVRLGVPPGPQDTDYRSEQTDVFGSLNTPHQVSRQGQRRRSIINIITILIIIIIIRRRMMMVMIVIFFWRHVNSLCSLSKLLWRHFCFFLGFLPSAS